MKKIISLGVMLVMCMSAGLLSGCESKPDFAINKVLVTIKTVYKEKFLAEDFTVEDFKWDNIERIEYRTWYENIKPESGWMVVYLKEQGKKRVLDAIKHFNTLDFVESAETDIIGYID